MSQTFIVKFLHVRIIREHAQHDLGPYRYDPDTHNCLDFVAAVLTNISRDSVDVTGHGGETSGEWSPWERDTVLRTAIKPAVLRLARYLKTVRRTWQVYK